MYYAKELQKKRMNNGKESHVKMSESWERITCENVMNHAKESHLK